MESQSRTALRSPARWGLMAMAVAMSVALGSCGSSPSAGSAASGTDVSEAAERGPSSQPEDLPSLLYEHLTLTEETPDGTVKWEIEADAAEYSQVGQAIALKNVDGEYFTRTNQPITVTAPTGNVSSDRSQLRLTGRVRSEAPHHQMALEADDVVWLPGKDRMIATGNVIATQTGRGIQLRGERLEIDWSTNLAQLRNPETDRPLLAEATTPPLDMGMTELDWDLSRELVTARGDVAIWHRDEKVRLTGNELTYEIATDMLTLTGNTVVNSETDRAKLWADQLEWILGSEITHAIGNVRYQQPDRDLTVAGSSGVANWATNTFSVSGPSTLTETIIPAGN